MRASSKRSSTSPDERPDLVGERRHVLVGLGEPVVDRLDHRLHRGERRAQVVARPRDQLAARLEQPLDRVGHRVERVGHLGDLGRPARSDARDERSPAASLAEAFAQAVERRADPAREQERREHARRGPPPRTTARTSVSACISNITQPGGEHAGERQDHREQRERGELQPQRRQQPQQQRGDRADRDRSEREQDRELDHGVSR